MSFHSLFPQFSTKILLVSFELQVFRFGTKDGRPADHFIEEHTYILQPVTGNAKYLKLQQNESSDSGEPLQKGTVSLDDVTLCLSKVISSLSILEVL